LVAEHDRVHWEQLSDLTIFSTVTLYFRSEVLAGERRGFDLLGHSRL
jgi:hypothetical protein